MWLGSVFQLRKQLLLSFWDIAAAGKEWCSDWPCWMTWRSRLQLKSPGWSWAEAFNSRDGTLWLLLSQGVPPAWDRYSEMQVGKAAARRDTWVCASSQKQLLKWFLGGERTFCSLVLASRNVDEWVSMHEGLMLTWSTAGEYAKAQHGWIDSYLFQELKYESQMFVRCFAPFLVKRYCLIDKNE